MTIFIDKDFIDAGRAGTVLEEAPLDAVKLPVGDLVKFRLYDDSGELYYEGRLTDDSDCKNQSAALGFGQDAGCTLILVERSGKWTQEIG